MEESLELFHPIIIHLLQKDVFGHVQEFLISDVKDESFRTIEGGDIKQEAAKGSEIPVVPSGLQQCRGGNEVKDHTYVCS